MAAEFLLPPPPPRPLFSPVFILGIHLPLFIFPPFQFRHSPNTISRKNSFSPNFSPPLFPFLPNLQIHFLGIPLPLPFPPLLLVLLLFHLGIERYCKRKTKCRLHRINGYNSYSMLSGRDHCSNGLWPVVRFPQESGILVTCDEDDLSFFL